MSTTSIVFAWITSQISSGPGETVLQILKGEEDPEMLPHRVTLPGSGKKAGFAPHE
jgi:hypothetical protein